MVEKGQVFKNYNALCKQLNEKPVNGNSKIKQMRRWSYLFRWHKKGHSIIIDEVYEDGEDPIDFRDGGNNSVHVDVMIPYVRDRILGVDPDEYLGTQRLVGGVLNLVPMAAYKQINNRGLKSEDFYKKYGLEEVGSFEEYVSVAGLVIKDTVIKCLRRMQKNKEIQFAEAEVFIVKDGRRRYLCIDGYDDLVKEVEYRVCNEMAAELGLKTKGRQLIHYIRGRKELMSQFHRRCIDELVKDNELVKDLKNQYLIVGPGRELNLENISEYYKVVHVIDYDEERIEKARGPDYDEKKQLKGIYEDLRPRVAVRVSSSKKDVSKIERMVFK